MPPCPSCITINIIIVTTISIKNYLNNGLSEYQKKLGQVEPTPEPDPQIPEWPGDDKKEERSGPEKEESAWE